MFAKVFLSHSEPRQRDQLHTSSRKNLHDRRRPSSPHGVTLTKASNSKLRCNHRSNSRRINSRGARHSGDSVPNPPEVHRRKLIVTRVSLSRKPRRAILRRSLQSRAKAFSILSKWRRSARKKPTKRGSSPQAPFIFLSQLLLSFPLHSSWVPVVFVVAGVSSILFLCLSLFCLSLGAVPLSRIANDEARIDKGPSRSLASTRRANARRRPGIRRPVTGNRSCRPHWPANHPKSRVRHVCNADPGKPEPPAAPTTPACLWLPACPALYTSVCAPLLSRYRGNVFRPVRVHYRHAGRFTGTRAVRARPRLISTIYGAVACFVESRQRRRRLLQDRVCRVLLLHGAGRSPRLRFTEVCRDLTPCFLRSSLPFVTRIAREIFLKERVKRLRNLIFPVF